MLPIKTVEFFLAELFKTAGAKKRAPLTTLLRKEPPPMGKP